MNIKVKIMTERSPGSLETEINRWLAKNFTYEVIDIKYKITQYDMHSAMIIYK